MPPTQKNPTGQEARLMDDLRYLAKSSYPLCPEARLLLEMAVETQLGKPIDMSKLKPRECLATDGTAVCHKPLGHLYAHDWSRDDIA